MRTAMKKGVLVSLVLATIIASSCKEEQLTQEQEAAQLEALYIDIETMVSSVSCDDPSEWTFSAIGSKACGGPTGFVAYSSKMDTELFLQKVNEYTKAQKQFNERWEIFSDCSVPLAPAAVYCKNGVAIFSY